MISSKFIFISIFLFSLFGFCDMEEKMVSSSSVSSDMANMHGASAFNPGQSEISARNRMLANISYGMSLVAAISTLAILWIARRNVKIDSKKAKKYFMVGLALFVLAMVLFLMPKFLFLSHSFPGNFDMRAT